MAVSQGREIAQTRILEQSNYAECRLITALPRALSIVITESMVGGLGTAAY